MTQETLREALKRLFKQHHSNSCYPDAMEHEQDKFADAAIATMFERLRTPSEGMVETGEYAWMNRDLSDPDSHPIRDCFRAMLTAFQQENSDER